ncbi:MAG: hypothetical protein R6V05_03225 [Candidatus Brocadiia bacterium]
MAQGKNNSRKVRRLVAIAVLVIAAITVALAGRLDAQAQALQRTEAEPRRVAQVGTYDPQKAFEQSPAQEELMEAYEASLPALREAEQKGDQQKAQQLQQKLVQKREQLIGEFQNDVRAALPDVAKAAGVQVVALDIVYTEESVNTKDITPQIVEAIADGPPGEEALPPLR